MDRFISPLRLAAGIITLILVTAVYFAALYKLQIIEGEAYYERSQNSIVTTRSVTAARGNILDRYGRVLVSNRSCNNLVINTDELFDKSLVADPNAAILTLVGMVLSRGDSYIDELPITMEPPFEYEEGMSTIDRTRLEAYIAAKESDGLQADITAVELMAYFRDRFDIDSSYTAEETRIIAGIRYALNMHFLVPTSDYIFAQDVGIDLITSLMESDIKGYDVDVSYIREYKTIYAAHLLGYVSPIYDSEVEMYKELNYPLDALVGRAGVEKQFEQYLHGKDGKAAVTSTASGTVISTHYTTEPEPGGHISLTIDIGLQEVSEQSLANAIIELNEAREEANEKAELAGDTKAIEALSTGGAVVAVKVGTGEPLAVASYPTFDLAALTENFTQNYDDILEAENDPLFNRALFGNYAPGSTFKPVTAIAALDTGKITVDTTYYDNITYTEYEDDGYAPKCWSSVSHGDVNVAQAVKVSCNYFFYSVGDLLSIDTLSQYALRFGLGKPTGIELDESIGHMSTREYMQEAVGRDWYAGDTLAASIGQAISVFTPLQLASYTATLASSGTRYESAILRSVRSYDYSELIYSRQPRVIETVATDQSFFDAIQSGMKGVANDVDGSAYPIFGNLPYTVACKTGTAQMGDNQMNNAVFICYAPADDPQIAVAVVVEKGGAGSSLAPIAKNVLDYYFDSIESTAVLEDEMTLLR